MNYSMEWTLVVEKLKCCGVRNYTDFAGSSFERTTGHTYPRSCCKSIETVACDGRNVSTDVIHQKVT
ncbi:transmembrane 4 superfamily member 16-like protein [Camelus ferus]|nr:transmembrane 4 superfamily member 16-like protein [Camelus ferus]